MARIKRNLTIDASTIRFLNDEEVSRFAQFDTLADYIDEKQSALAESNANKDTDAVVNCRRLTNIGTLRAYRQLPPPT